MLNKTSHHLFSYHVISSPFRIMPSYYPHSCHIFISYQTHIIRIYTEKVINWKLNMQLLTHALTLVSFYTSWKHQKASSIKWVQTLIYLGLTNYNCILKSKRKKQNKQTKQWIQNSVFFWELEKLFLFSGSAAQMCSIKSWSDIPYDRRSVSIVLQPSPFFPNLCLIF